MNNAGHTHGVCVAVKHLGRLVVLRVPEETKWENTTLRELVVISSLFLNISFYSERFNFLLCPKFILLLLLIMPICNLF